MDTITVEILRELRAEGRISFRELGERVGLSAPAVTERVRRLERDGVIRGYHADIDPAALGYPLLTIVRVHSAGMNSGKVDELARELPEVVECHRVTGSESHVLRVRVRDMAHLDQVIERLWEFGDTISSVVTTTPVPSTGAPLPPR